jgi:predicted DNA-binding transcriptional regulator YafY
MPLNKEALIRYRVINRCLVDFRYVSKEKLITACEEALDIAPIGERTIEQDIHDMREDGRLGYYAPIKYSRESGAYFYEDPAYTIDNIPLNEEEVKALSFIATMLDQFRHIGIFTTFSGAVQKIIDAVNIHRILKEEAPLPFVEFEKTPLIRGSEYLELLIKAIRQKKVISFGYHRFTSDTAYTVTLHPFLLKEYRNRWYLVGLNHELHQIRIYGLERFVDSPVIQVIPYTSQSFDPKAFFRHTIGIIAPDREPEDIVLKFSKLQSRYILTQPIHESQKVIEESNDHVMISLHIVPTYEFTMMLLGWGKEVEVVGPEMFRNEILALLSETIRQYQ